MNILSGPKVSMSRAVTSLRLAVASAIRRPVVLALVWVAIFTGHAVSENAPVQKYQFRDYPAASVHTGKTALPDFSGRDREFRQYRTRIREGMKQGPNFAGEFSLIQVGCGTGCSFAFVANNRSGRVFRFPRGGEQNLFMQFAKRIDSRLLILQWGSYRTDSCVIEYFEWNNGEAKPLGSTPVGNAEACFRTVDETLARLK